ncbi:MAG: outer membrane lipoprotein carrier protein LolA [Desulfobacterales bacterium]|nr:outer membrane lipoprotein carrier protein LolA [Desulfobacterales bacterium]
MRPTMGRVQPLTVAGIVLLASAFLSGGWAHARDGSWADSWEGIRSSAGTVDSVQATFVQEKHLKMLLRPLVSRGVLYYRAPADLRWEYRTPLRSVMLMTQGRCRRFVETGGAMAETDGAGLDAMPVVMQEITGWLQGRFEENAIFSAALAPGRKIVLTPKNPSMAGIIQRIELVLSDRAGFIDAVYIYESEDSYTRLVFSDTVINRPLADAIFLKAP